MREYADGVRAAEIARIDTLCNSVFVAAEGGGQVLLSGSVHLFLGAHWPRVGDFVVWAADGRREVVPRGIFLATRPVAGMAA